jgi:hypothetical protein
MMLALMLAAGLGRARGIGVGLFRHDPAADQRGVAGLSHISGCLVRKPRACHVVDAVHVGDLRRPRVVQSVGFWLLFFVFDAFSAVDAAGDARMADERARVRASAAREADGAADAFERA